MPTERTSLMTEDSLSESHISQLRKEYTVAGLSEKEAEGNPIKQFDRWLQQAISAGLPEPTAMTLATATPDGKPSARIVLLKDFDSRGFVFFTNYNSRKGRELQANAHVALVFHWVELERQVRVDGLAERVSREESTRYYATRPLGSQLGAWASNQSEVISGREILEERIQELTAHYHDRQIPVPPHWGGFRVKVLGIEFWQGRPNRLHDRLRYLLRSDGTWRIERLSP